MAEREILLKALDAAHWELSEALQGLADDDVWTRADPRLLSVGEQLAHIAYWEAKAFLGEDFESPLIREQARYYTSNVDEPLRSPLSADAAAGEVKRVHESTKAAFLTASPDLSAQNPHREGWTWEDTLIYQAFHVAYHTGQIYSVRHLLGHETVDN